MKKPRPAVSRTGLGTVLIHYTDEQRPMVHFTNTILRVAV